jgi:hypothetical protein
VSTQFFPLEGCYTSAKAMQTALAAGILHLFKSTFVPEPATPLASYNTAEANYDAYAAIALTPWFNPILAPGTGYMIGSPEVQFEVGVTDPAVGNIIGGCYLVDAGGKLRLTVIFTEPIPMQLAGQGIPINLVWLFPTGV